MEPVLGLIDSGISTVVRYFIDRHLEAAVSTSEEILTKTVVTEVFAKGLIICGPCRVYSGEYVDHLCLATPSYVLFSYVQFEIKLINTHI